LVKNIKNGHYRNKLQKRKTCKDHITWWALMLAVVNLQVLSLIKYTVKLSCVFLAEHHAMKVDSGSRV